MALSRSRILLVNPLRAEKTARRENQLVRALDVGANSTENGLSLASVTTPLPDLLLRQGQAQLRAARQPRPVAQCSTAWATGMLPLASRVGA